MDQGRWALVGRDAACAAIASALEDEPPRSLVIVGPAGVGRTRLAREALSLAQRAGQPTRWARGTGAAAFVPLGALAHLLATIDVSSDALVLLQRAAHAIAGDGSGPVPVLGVDDVHLLDPLSVTLLHQLAASGAVTLVLSVRTGNATPDPAAPLWKDGLATRIELQPLRRSDTERLISQALGGDVETRTGERLWRLSQGSPLFLRELLEDGVRTGRLGSSCGLWRWEGPVVPSGRLTEIVLAQLGHLDATEWRALEVLATAEPVSVHQLAALSSPEAVASLARRGVVTDAEGGSGAVRAGHPLYVEVVRSQAPAAAMCFIQRRLAEERTGNGLDGQLVRRCVALLDSGVSAPDAPMLAEAARRANAMLDHAAAERLARAGIDAGANPRAHLELVDASRWLGRPERSVQLAIEATRVVATEYDRARLTAARALTLFCGLRRGEDAAAALREAAATVGSEEARAVLAAAEAVLAFLGGDPERAVRLATPVLSSGGHGDASRPLAAAAAAAGLAVTGRTTEALATTSAGWAALRSERECVEAAFARVVLAQAEVMALHLTGRIHDLERRAAELHRSNLMAPEWAGDAIACLHRGWAALAGGRIRPATRWLVEALGGLRRGDPVGLEGLCRQLLAMAKALSGDRPGARELLGDLGSTPSGPVRVFDPQARLAQAWLAGAENRSADAGCLVLDAAALAARQGQSAVEAIVLHCALRYGRAAEVVERLRDLAERLDSPFVVDLAAHAEAVAVGAGDRLDAIGHRFEGAGALLFAADAAAEAAAAHERAGDRRAAAVSRARAAALARGCGLADTPALDLLAPPALTSREEEVARLAVQGLSNQEIAHQLVVSVRTVEAHLAHVYTKFGIKGRADLRTTLTMAEWALVRGRPTPGGPAPRPLPSDLLGL
ncbi:regulatory LuxR family protein [Blastococcus colisei]|uniref:Regulatory LuxR family protein n=1 Tax=Blastococcus colisei TaxID=1564162 RepID=A0A543PGR4_9ACTN|nr:LuxR C-terminal-related transcriptional regulator [Blastococcus colisei]TQN43269.1 regulatory LuxR family protein [Blastococcus colisei]